MEEGLRFAAIDVGSNAMRLFFCRVLENSHGPMFVKESMIRMPLRLGHDALPPVLSVKIPANVL